MLLTLVPAMTNAMPERYDKAKRHTARLITSCPATIVKDQSHRHPEEKTIATCCEQMAHFI